jgi:hypothetical protein
LAAIKTGILFLIVTICARAEVVIQEQILERKVAIFDVLAKPASGLTSQVKFARQSEHLDKIKAELDRALPYITEIQINAANDLLKLQTIVDDLRRKNQNLFNIHVRNELNETIRQIEIIILETQQYKTELAEISEIKKAFPKLKAKAELYLAKIGIEIEKKTDAKKVERYADQLFSLYMEEFDVNLRHPLLFANHYQMKIANGPADWRIRLGKKSYTLDEAVSMLHRKAIRDYELK